jgi:hypothetical protein
MKYAYYRAVHACSGSAIGYMLVGTLVAESQEEAEKAARLALKKSFGKVERVD